MTELIVYTKDDEMFVIAAQDETEFALRMRNLRESLRDYERRIVKNPVRVCGHIITPWILEA